MTLLMRYTTAFVAPQKNAMEGKCFTDCLHAANWIQTSTLSFALRVYETCRSIMEEHIRLPKTNFLSFMGTFVCLNVKWDPSMTNCQLKKLLQCIWNMYSTTKIKDLTTHWFCYMHCSKKWVVPYDLCKENSLTSTWAWFKIFCTQKLYCMTCWAKESNMHFQQKQFFYSYLEPSHTKQQDKLFVNSIQNHSAPQNYKHSTNLLIHNTHCYIGKKCTLVCNFLVIK